jgi:methanogenic corrinoid protein MtbC1
MASKEELLEKLKHGVIEYQEDEVKEAAQAVLDEGYKPLEAVMDGLAAGMEVVGDLYEKQEYFVPEVLMCADALYAGLDILRPHIPEQEGGLNAQVVIGSIQGDVHDIGKNLVKMMFDVAIMLGGAPVTQDVANLFGADGYAESAGNAVTEGIKMIGRLREMQKK